MASHRSSSLTIRNLTAEAQSDPTSPSPFDADPHYESLFDQLARALHRCTTRHAFLCGESGVGKNLLLTEFARRAARGSIPFLARTTLLYADLKYAPPAEAFSALGGLCRAESGGGDCVVAVHGLSRLLHKNFAPDAAFFLPSLLASSRARLILLVTPQEREQFATELAEAEAFFSDIHVAEPDVPRAERIVGHLARGLEQHYRLQIEPAALHCAVLLSGNYILNEHLPGKASGSARTWTMSACSTAPTAAR